MEGKVWQKLLSQIKKNQLGTDIIDLSSKGIRSTHAQALAEILLHSASYRALILGDNEIDDDGGFALAQLIAENRTMTELDVSFNHITDRAANQILLAIKSSSTLLQCSLMGNRCSAGMEHDIQQLLAERRALQPLSTSPTENNTRLARGESKRKGIRGALGLGKGFTVSFASSSGAPTPSGEDSSPPPLQALHASTSTPDMTSFSNQSPPDSDSSSKKGSGFGIFPRFKTPRSPRKEVSPDSKATTRQIFTAVAENDIKSLNEFVRRRVNLQCTDRNGRRPIHLAAMKKSTEALRVLLEAGVNPDSRDRWGDTPLHWAAFKGDLQAMAMLLEFGANYSLFTITGTYPIHAAVRGGTPKCVEKLLEHGAAADVKNDKGLTPLHLAVLQDRVDIVQVLLKHGAVATSLDAYGRTGLHWASFRDSPSICKLLIEHGANVNATDVNGMTALHFAIVGGSQATVKLLKEHNTDVNATDRNGKTPLHFAAFHGDCAILELFLRDEVLLKSGIDAKDKWDETPLHWAIVRGNIPAASRLIFFGADPNATNKRGDTALHMLARIPLVADPNAIPSSMKVSVGAGFLLGATSAAPSIPISASPPPQGEVATSMSPPVVSPIRNRNVQATFNSSPTRSPSRTGGLRVTDAQQHVRNHVEGAIKFLLSQYRNSDLDVANEDGDTAIHIAASRGNDVAMSLLLDAHAHPSLLNKEGKAPLHLAAGSGSVVCLVILLKKQPITACNIPSGTGEAAIHFAAAKGQYKVLQHLISCNADFGAVDKDGRTAIHTAKTVKCASLLVEAGCPLTNSLSGFSPLDSAVTLGNVSVGVWLVANDKVPLPSDFASNGLDCRSPGSMLLHLAASQGDPQLIRTLVEKGFPVNATTEKGLTPLAVAAALGNLAAATVLVENGANITLEIIQLAVKTENLSVSDFLRGVIEAPGTTIKDLAVSNVDTDQESQLDSPPISSEGVKGLKELVVCETDPDATNRSPSPIDS